MEKAKQIASLIALLVVGLVVAVAEPEGFLAVLLTQVIALAVIGAGGLKLSKPLVSLVVLAVAAVLAYFKVDAILPSLPIYAGDPAAFAAGLFAFAQAFVVAAAPIVGSAMLQYNVILERLMTIIGDRFGYTVEPIDEE